MSETVASASVASVARVWFLGFWNLQECGPCEGLFGVLSRIPPSWDRRTYAFRLPGRPIKAVTPKSIVAGRKAKVAVVTGVKAPNVLRKRFQLLLAPLLNFVGSFRVVALLGPVKERWGNTRSGLALRFADDDLRLSTVRPDSSFEAAFALGMAV